MTHHRGLDLPSAEGADDIQEALDNADAVALLREALARAESGQTVAIALAEVHSSGTVATAISTGAEWVRLTGAAAMMAHRLAGGGM